jgi:hypothetical protein
LLPPAEVFSATTQSYVQNVSFVFPIPLST